MDARVLIEALQGRGLSISLAGDKVRVEGSKEPDGETKALIQEIREHKDEIKSVLAKKVVEAKDDPIVSEETWLPEYLAFRN